MKYSQIAVRSALACAVACTMAAHSFAQNVPDLKVPKKAFGTLFHPANVKPYIDDVNKMFADMKSVTTPQQAAVFAEKFKADLPRIEANLKRYLAGLPHVGDAIHSGTKTAEISQAEALLNEVTAKGPALEAEMARVENLNPGIKAHFQRFRAMHD